MARKPKGDIIPFEEKIGITPKVVRPKYIFGRPTKYQPDWMLDKIIDLGITGASRAKIALTLGITHETLIQWERQGRESRRKPRQRSPSRLSCRLVPN
jgi:transposase-like protein